MRQAVTPAPTIATSAVSAAGVVLTNVTACGNRIVQRGCRAPAAARADGAQPASGIPAAPTSAESSGST